MQKKKVLLAEDNPVNQKVASLIIKKLNYEPEVVDSGRKALEAMKSKKYHAVFMDVQMPEMDGLQATRAIRAWEAQVRVKNPVVIIAITANAHESDRDICLNAGMNDFIAKPFTVEQMRDVLEKIIDKKL